jgi:sulfonate transport system substrate-binding protein
VYTESMRLWLVFALASLAWLAACGRDDASTLRLGYFPNVTHAAPLVGTERGTFAAELDKAQRMVSTSTFNAGPAAIEALLSGALDASYLGPNPAINGHVKSKGDALRVVAGATSGGAFFVVHPDIDDADDLRGKTVASPQLGGTQDVALRTWLAGEGLTTSLEGGGDVSIAPQENAQILEAFQAGSIAGAWVPEPWATRLVLEAGGKVLVDESTLWPNGRYVTTHLVVRREYLEQQPEAVAALLRAHVETTAWIVANPKDAQAAVIAGIEKVTGKKLSTELVATAWPHLEFTTDPLQDSLRRSADDAVSIGLLKLDGVDLATLYELGPLQRALAETKEQSR